MAAIVLELGLSNLAVAASIALLAMAAGQWGRRPALTHALWLLVLLKLVTPAILHLPVRLLPAESTTASEIASTPTTGEMPTSIPVAEQLASTTMPARQDTTAKTQLKPIAKKPKAFNDLNSSGAALIPAESVGATPGISVSPDSGEAPAGTPLIPLGPVEAIPETSSSNSPISATIQTTAATIIEPVPSQPAKAFPWATVIAIAWLSGSIAWLGLMFRRVRRFARILDLAADAPPWLVCEVTDMARKLGLVSIPQVKLIPGAIAPMVWSLGRTAIYLPTELIDRLLPQQRASLVAHELAHLKRGDHWVRWLELVVIALYWWCPLTWFARRELQRAEEECCDAWVVATLPTGGHAYATALLDTLDFLAEAPRAPALASGMGSAAAIKRRLLLILDGRTPKRLPLVGRLMVIFAALLLLPIAPKLARLAGAVPIVSALMEEPKQAKTPAAVEPATAAIPKNATPTLVSANPRGEPLFFEPKPVDVRPGSTNWWSVSVSPDGKRIATSQGDLSDGKKGEVKIWDHATGKITNVIREPKGVRAVAFSPDGKMLATGNYDGILRFYETATFTLLASGEGHKSGINGLCFFKNGKHLATAGLDNTARIWDITSIPTKAKTGDPMTVPSVAIFEGHSQSVLSVSVSADGQTLLTGSQDRTARCYDVPNPLPAPGEEPARVKKERVLLQDHNSAVETVAVSPDGQLLATGSWDSQSLIHDRDGKLTASFGFQVSVMCLAFNNDGKYLAAGAGSMTAPGIPGEIRVWDVAGKKEAAHQSDYLGSVLGLAFTPDSKTIVSVGQDQGPVLWAFVEKHRKTFTPPRLALPSQPFLAVAASLDGSLLAFSGESQSIFVYHRAEDKIVAELTGHEDVVASLEFSPDGKTLASASYDKSIKLWNTETWKERRSLTGHTGWVSQAVFSPDGHILASGSYDKTVRLWNVETGEPKATWKDHSAGIRSVAFSPDGKKLVSGGSDRIPRVWDVAEGKVLLTLKGHKNAVRSVAFSPDGKSIASGSEDRTVKIWNAENGKETTTFTNLPDMVTAVRYSPKGQTLIAATFQGPIALLDPLTSRVRQTLRAHNEPVTAIAFTDNSQNFISVSQDRTIRQWSIVKAAIAIPAQTLTGKFGIINATASTPNGTAVALGSSDGSVTIWDLKTETLIPYPGSHIGGIAHLAISDELRIASIGKDGAIIVGSVASKDTWKGKGSFVAFTPDGKHLAIAEGKDIVLRDSASGNELKRFVGGHDGNVVRFDFSPDGTRLISAGDDTKVRLWNAATGEKLQETPAFGNYSAITHLAFSPDGSRFAAAAYGPDRPPNNMRGNFRITREVRVFAIPSPEAAFGKSITFSPQPADQPTTSLHWVPGGQALVSSASDGTVRLTELGPNGPREVQRFRAHDGPILAMSVAADVFVTTGEDMAVQQWYLPQPASPMRAARISGPFRGSPILVGEFDPSGRYLFTSTAWDKMLQVFTQPPNPTAVEFERGYGGVSSVAYSRDGKLLATGHEGGALFLWDTTTGRRMSRLTGVEWWVRGLAFTPDGKTLVAVGQGTENPERPGDAVVFDIPTLKIRHRLAGSTGHPWQLILSPDGSIAAAPCSDGLIRLWEVNTGKLLRTIGTHPKGVRAIAFSPDGSILVSGGFDGTLRIWNTSTWEQTRSIMLPNALPNGIAFTPNGKEVVIATLRNAPPPWDRIDCAIYALKVDDANAQPREFSKGHVGAAVCIAVLKDGITVVSGGGREGEMGEIKIWDLPSGKLLGDFRGHSTVVEGMAVAPDGRTVVSGAWSRGQSGELRQWDAGGFRPMATIPATTGPHVSAAAASPDGNILAIGGGDGVVTTFDMTDPAHPVQRHTVTGKHTSNIGSLTFDASGKRFVTADESGKVIVWDSEKAVPLKEWQASTLIVFRAKFTPDGKSVVTAAGNWKNPKIPGEMRVWNPQTGAEIARFPNQSAAIWDIAFLDGGKTLVSTQALNGSQGEAPVKVWDFATRSENRSITIPGGMRCLAISPDEKYLAVATNSGTIKLIHTRTWQVVSTPPPHARAVFRLSFHADSNTLYSVSEDGTVGITRIPDQKWSASPEYRIRTDGRETSPVGVGSSDSTPVTPSTATEPDEESSPMESDLPTPE